LNKAKVIAHRGFSGKYIENSKEAIEQALALNVDAIEIDIRPNADAIPVVFHDTTLKRLSGINASIKDVPLASLKQPLTLKQPSGGTKTTQILTLGEVFELVDGQCELIVEIKTDQRLPSPRFLMAVLNCIREHNASQYTILQAFNAHVLQLIHAISPIPIQLHQLIVLRVPLTQLSVSERGQRTQPFTAPHISGINVDYRFTTKRLIQRIQKNGKSCYVWTVNDVNTMKRFLNWGVNGIITNYPDALQKLVSGQ